MAIINPHTSGDGTLFRIASKMISVLAAAALIAGFGLSSCTTGPAEQEAAPPPVPVSLSDSPSWLWDSRPENGRLVFIAAGGRRGNRDNEALAALDDAALQAGVYANFWGASQDFVVSDGGGTDWNTRTRARYDGSAEDSAKVNMDADAIWRTEEATWVRFILDDPRVPVINWTPVYRGGVPEWIRRTPDIPGYHVTVGIGGERSTLALTIKGSEVSALAGMVDLLHGASRTVTASRETAGAIGKHRLGRHRQLRSRFRRSERFSHHCPMGG
jgi:hypothetical protein